MECGDRRPTGRGVAYRCRSPLRLASCKRRRLKPCLIVDKRSSLRTDPRMAERRPKVFRILAFAAVVAIGCGGFGAAYLTARSSASGPPKLGTVTLSDVRVSTVAIDAPLPIGGLPALVEPKTVPVTPKRAPTTPAITPSAPPKPTTTAATKPKPKQAPPPAPTQPATTYITATVR